MSLLVMYIVHYIRDKNLKKRTESKVKQGIIDVSEGKLKSKGKFKPYLDDEDK